MANIASSLYCKEFVGGSDIVRQMSDDSSLQVLMRHSLQKLKDSNVLHSTIVSGVAMHWL